MAIVASESNPQTVRVTTRRINFWDSPWLNAKFVTGSSIIVLIVLFGLLGPLFWNTDLAYTASSPVNLPPMWDAGGSPDHPLGTESNGRDMLAQLIVGIPASLKVGVMAASIGLAVGVLLGSIAGYMGGWPDHIIRTITDSVITIPSLMVLISIAAYVSMPDTTAMALILALFAWPGPTRLIRSQVLTLRERGYVRMALLSHVPTLQIMLFEMAPNMLPWLAASLAGGISVAILAATGLEALGLGPTRVPSLGMIINYALNSTALVRGMVWWWLPPIITLVVIFTAFFLMTIGLDEIANPRLRGGEAPSSTKEKPAPDQPTPVIEEDTSGENAKGALAPKVLEVKNLSVHYYTPRGAVIAANNVNFYIRRGEIVGLVGESGCGKTTVAMAILQMVQSPGKIVKGEIRINGKNIIGLSERRLRALRWRDLALVPQGAMNSLNPVLRIKEQIADAIRAHERINGLDLHQKTMQLLDNVGLPARVYNMYPHELSGGMKQRVCIAMAISLDPPLVIADEPTSALDVVVQKVVAETLLDVKEKLGVSMLMIGHDMGLQAQVVDRVAVMYAGNLVEISPVTSIFEQPLHPYTRLLIESIPSIEERKPLKVTEGVTHDLRTPPPGCIFQYRCPHVHNLCREQKPQLLELAPDHFVACHLYPAQKVA
jgi:oligopeptide/dipeptide ABC transporter ATP-binding protein